MPAADDDKDVGNGREVWWWHNVVVALVVENVDYDDLDIRFCKSSEGFVAAESFWLETMSILNKFT